MTDGMRCGCEPEASAELPVWRIVLRFARCWRQLRLEYRQLLLMNDRQLSDIGLSRIDAVQATRGPVWRDCLGKLRVRRGTRMVSKCARREG